MASSRSASAGPRAVAADPPGQRQGTGSVTGSTRPPGNHRRLWRHRLRRDRALLLMTVPGLLLLILFQYLPLLGNVIAFQDYVPFLGFRNAEFVGLANFRALFADPAFWNAVANTLIITLLNLLLFFPVPIALALLLDSLFHERIKKFVQGVMFLPHFISWVVIVALFTQVLGGAGVINQFLLRHDMEPVHIIGNASVFKLLLVAEVIWKDAGWACIIFLAALSAIDSQLYESSAVDGAGYWRRMFHITLPGIRPVIIILILLRLGDALSIGFEQVLLQRDSVGPDAAEVLDTYVYYFGVQGGNWSIAAAAGLFKAVVGLILVLSANKVAHMLGEDGVYRRP
ncbi:sugar ABC transporter permease [Phytoactinopolyspora halotolerans]|uniref:Sugar ABC transporter permease n=2 Tax=Phytoactinopolyspora halotolerans TaxID=1981512 RepID=A0A6L9SAZ4_9ACTN|nr:sugar ABC transporter permease [Phytoactinopolyspora halotolerans]